MLPLASSLRMETTQFKKEILSLSDKLYRFAKSFLHDEEAARDAVQDLNLKLWEKRNHLDEVQNFSAFAMRSMRNHCLDILRQNNKTENLEADIEYKELNPYERAEQMDMVHKIHCLIDMLPEMQRTIIRMRDVEGMEIREIAYVMQITDNAVSANLSRARQKIREQILKEHQIVEERVWR